MDTNWIFIRLVRLFALLPALTLHEFAHAYSATRCGDPTPAAHGRVTLNPLAHLDPLGTLMILFAPIGWAKPVPINPANFRYPSRDIIITTAVGPLSNLVQGVFWCFVIRVLLLVMSWQPAMMSEQTAGLVLGLLWTMAMINFALCIFNLIPLGSLDGHHILEYTLPYDQAVRYRSFNARYGFFVLIGLIFLGPYAGINLLGAVIFNPSEWLAGFLSGLST